MKQHSSHIRLRGVARQDPAFALLLLPAYQEALGAVASYTYRSLLSGERSQELSTLFDRMATDALEQFQTLGELIVALGGNPVIYTPPGSEAAVLPSGPLTDERLRQFVQDSIREERRAVEDCETLLGKTDDRVVRSVLLQTVREKQFRLHTLTALCG